MTVDGERERWREGERNKQWKNGKREEILGISLGEGSHLEEGGQKGAREGDRRNIQRNRRIRVM